MALPNLKERVHEKARSWLPLGSGQSWLGDAAVQMQVLQEYIFPLHCCLQSSAACQQNLTTHVIKCSEHGVIFSGIRKTSLTFSLLISEDFCFS